MTYCHVCERDTETYGEMEPGRGVVLKCCVCKAAARGPVAAPAQVLPALTAEAVVPPAPRSQRIIEAPPVPGLTAAALLDAARVRRAAVGAALAEMAALQAEALVLDRILAAAEPLN